MHQPKRAPRLRAGEANSNCSCGSAPTAVGALQMQLRFSLEVQLLAPETEDRRHNSESTVVPGLCHHDAATSECMENARSDFHSNASLRDPRLYNELSSKLLTKPDATSHVGSGPKKKLRRENTPPHAFHAQMRKLGFRLRKLQCRTRW
jgi:hypothetical protein